MLLRALVSRHRERKSSSNKMVAGLNGGQTKQNGRHKSQHRTELKHTHINLAVLIRHSLKYKNVVSRKTFYRDTKLQMSSKISKGGKEARLKEGGGGGGKAGQKGWPYRRPLPPADTQVLWDFSLGFQRREDWNSALPETRPENLSSLPRGGDRSPILSSSWGPSTWFLCPGRGD